MASNKPFTAPAPNSVSEEDHGHEIAGHEIAVIGMSGRFPGAPDVESFWRNLRDGVESITFFSEEELRDVVEPALLNDPRYVKAKALVAGEALFDAGFFGFTPREAEVRDPQHRFFLECAWEALENAGYDPERYDDLIAVYAGAGSSAYAWNVLQRNPALVATVGAFQMALANEKDYLPTLISYKLRLRGPSFSVQCACSTSLVAIHLACQSLAGYECDMALAGGVTLGTPQKGGYLYQEGGILSPDGHCRAFDSRARGTAPGNGAGVVVLKRLADALADGDSIAAVIKGSAVNNDGGNKVGYTAPSVDGQREVIGAALAMAGVAARQVSYVEAHGTGTALGDPIEIAALRQAFAEDARATQETEEEATESDRAYCAIGSVKSNIGHLDTAAGVAGFIKTVLALQHRQLPPTLHVERENPAIDFATGPFRVQRTLTPWQPDRLPRRAGVSSFGIGGTNAHLILEEAPPAPPSAPARARQLLPLSARTAEALDRATRRLRTHLEANPGLNLADVAFTLQVGRKPFDFRRAIVAADLEEAVRRLAASSTDLNAAPSEPPLAARTAPRVAFLFPGQGSQYPAMARELYRSEPTFAHHFDRCREILQPHCDIDPLRFVQPETSDGKAGDAESRAQLARTEIAQPVLFAVEYSLARLWMEWGVEPAAMAGHSLGEWVAACLAGVLSLDQALPLVAVRGRLMQSMPPGSMLAVTLAEEPLEARLPAGLVIAAVNAPAACTVSGPSELVAAFARELAVEKITSKPLHTSHAFHSPLVDSILPAWREELGRVELREPRRPFLSNLSGAWITATEARDPDYWVRHLRHAVRFAAASQTLLLEGDLVLLEVGPGSTLRTLARKQPAARGRLMLASLPHPTRDEGGDLATMLGSLGQLWVAGHEIDWPSFHRHTGPRRRVALPTYPFERRPYWAGARPAANGEPQPAEREPSPHLRPAEANALEAPSDELEKAIVAIWEQLLGVEGVGRDDDFFELGGDSLLAVNLMSRLEETLGKVLPISALSRGATVAELARQARATQTSSPLVELRCSTRNDSAANEKAAGKTSRLAGEGGSWVWIHPIGGDVLCYLKLANRLAAGPAVWAIRSPGLEPGETALTSVEAMAEHYLDLLRAADIATPYRLGGWSFGGLVAYEMGRRLAQLGTPPSRVVLLDSAPLAGEQLAAFDPALRAAFDRDSIRGARSPQAERPELLAWFLRDLAGGQLGEPQLLTAQLAELKPGHRLDFLTERAIAAGILPSRTGADRLHRLLAVFTANLEAALRYHPRPFPGELLLIEASEGAPGRARDGWRGLTGGGLFSHELPANHYSLLQDPYIDRVVELLATTKVSALATDTV